MTIVTRLRKLEAVTSSPVADRNASTRLLARLEIIFSRLVVREVSTEWLAGQSNETAFAIALFGPLPRKACVTAKLQQVAAGEGSTTKFAKATLQAVI